MLKIKKKKNVKRVSTVIRRFADLTRPVLINYVHVRTRRILESDNNIPSQNSEPAAGRF